METTSRPLKAECINPNTGGRMNIDRTTYDLFSKAIYHTLKKHGPQTYADMVDGIYECFAEQKIKFDGSVEWYAITVKHDMHARGIIDVYTEKRKKLHRIKK